MPRSPGAGSCAGRRPPRRGNPCRALDDRPRHCHPGRDSIKRPARSEARRPRLPNEGNLPMTHPRSGTVLALALLTALAGGANAIKPNSKPEEKPPYQRLLQGDDAKRAAALEKRIE